jgi:glucokinase
MTAAMSGAEAVGVDLGGTKMLVGVVGSDMSVLHRNVATSYGQTQEAVLDLLERELRAAIAARPAVAAIGLGVPCTIDRTRGVCVNAANLPLADVALRDVVSERIGLPVSMDNDANVAALAEHRHGAGRGATNVVLLTIGTGIGGGLIINGELYRGSSGAGAELGHMVLVDDGPACAPGCPNNGCVECYVSGTALAREGLEAALAEPDSELGRLHADAGAIDGPAVTVAAANGDETALAIFDRMGRRLGAALSGLANAFDPDVIVIGGGVGAAGELLLGPAREELRRRALPPQNEVPLIAAELGPEAGMIGAATLALEELRGSRELV